MNIVISQLINYVFTTLGVVLLTGLIHFFRLDGTSADVPILYLLVVTLAALFLGRGAAIWSSFCSFLAINWFFVTPRYTFTVQEPTEWITLYMFLFTAIVTGNLMAMLKKRALEASQRQMETAALAEASWAIASQLDTKSALSEVVKQVAKVADLQVAAIIAVEGDEQMLAAVYPDKADFELKTFLEMASVSIGKEQKVDTTSFPIEMNGRTLGTVVIRLAEGRCLSGEQRQIVHSLVNQSAVVLQRDGLMKAQSKAKALADAHRLKTALLSMVSHDFRSPLTAIKASVSTLLAEGQPLDAETQRGLYQAIEQEADRLNRIVGNILDLSRLEAGAWRPKLENTAIPELIGMVLDQFSDESNKRIEVRLDPNLTEIAVDCVQMVQVVKNLVENALKYSYPDTTVEIVTRADQEHVLIEVLDRGRGLSSTDIDQIFEPFYRGAGLTESAVPGVGIGLAVCRGLVEAHGGTLVGHNRQAGGSIFTIALPLSVPELMRVGAA